ncbi:UbiX family flavin prenyltransferase [Stappia sp. F7233]|uniref:Flavin prenyltransferase UbiX n=1 Tax=Stappia albiluteola TaxID=2758565 RepID=A0A839A800_9HYPH|nr:UbiX family flavin prenyltransferase [Stappia albiluteola]
MRIVVGATGASGSMLALETLRQLRDAGAETHLVVSASAPVTIAHELGSHGLEQLHDMATAVHEATDIAAPIASGSFDTDGMIVAPCSMRTLSAIAHGFGDGLLTRAADVTLKERRRLVLLPREAPLHEIHLNSMLTLSRMGVVIAPPVPHFYAKPQTIEDAVREIAARALIWLGIDPGERMTRWDGVQSVSGD